MKYLLSLLIITILTLNLSVITDENNQLFVLVSVLLSLVLVPTLMAYVLKVFLSHYQVIKHQLRH
jgi:uncharacterized membrane protein YesL